jgi:iron complex transport system permease protein
VTQAVAVARAGAGRLALLGGAAAAAVAVLGLLHLSQGTAALGPDALWRVLTGSGGTQADAVLAASRLPRLVAGLVVGAALGAAGAALQSVSRNPLASPDTLAVNAGAYLAVVAAAAFGLALPALPAGATAFAGGLLAAVAVLGLFYSQETTGLFAWGNGSLVQTGMAGITQLLPLAAVAFAGLLAMSRRLDILGLGDDGAVSVGVDPRTTRAVVVVLAVLLSAVAVTIAGPIAFVGLCAPAVVRLLAPRVPGLGRHRAFLPASAVAGVLVVLTADVLLRAVFGAQAGVSVPTGVVTTVFGAVVLVYLAYRSRDSSSNTATTAFVRLRSRRAFVIALGVCCALLVCAVVAAVLLGDARLLLGDVANWVGGRAGRVVSYVLDTRLPRVGAALLAGAALALAGAIVQAVSRNPLAEPGVLGVVGGAGVGAIAVITAVPLASFWAVGGAALAGAAAAALLVFGLAARRGLEQNRLILIGIGVWSGTTALTSLLIVLTDPYNAAKALVWLSGSTYGRTLDQVLPVLVALAVAVPLLAASTRRLDLVGLDPDTPRLLGVPLSRTRLGLLSIAVVLTATAVAAVGVIGFVGLVAPHAARSLVGQRHARVLPVAALLGALLVSVADTVGRTVIAPAQIPVGLVTAVIGAPYFLWLLYRSRAES